ncbi:MAG: EamA/RhaT family transporter [Rhodobacteraceae bacterium]|nr:MAG: EamA/RhaT family transporter [Paracoccaceae bacterium]
MFVHEKRPILGIIFIILSVVFGLIAGLLIKKSAQDASLVTTLLYRFIFAVPLLLVFTILARGRSALKVSQKKMMLMRIIFGFTGMVFWVLAIRNLPLGQASALFQSSAILVTILSPFLLFEPVGVYRWTSVILGLFGIILLTDPFSGHVSFYIVYGFLAALSGALLSIVLRRLGKGDHSLTVALIYNTSGAVLMTTAVFVFPSEYHLENFSILFDLILLGVVSAISQIFFTGAYHFVDAVIVTTLRYLQVPLAGITAFLLFAEIMTMNEIIGATTVIISCLIIGWREFQKSDN